MLEIFSYHAVRVWFDETSIHEDIGETQYLALLLRADQGHVSNYSLIPIGPERDLFRFLALHGQVILKNEEDPAMIASVVAEGGRAIATVSSDEEYVEATDVDPTWLWSLLQHIDSVRQLYICPSGGLATASFDRLPAYPEGQLIDKVEITHLYSAGELVRLSRQQFAPSTAPVVIGAPDFWTTIANGYAGSTVDSVVNKAVFPDLESTRAEVWDVAALLGSQPITGRDATTESLLTVRSPAVLHISTHGFASVDRKGLLDALDGSGAIHSLGGRWLAERRMVKSDHTRFLSEEVT